MMCYDMSNVPSILSQLPADFVTIDEEMSGIHNPEFNMRNKKHDDPDGRYAKMVPVAKRYAMIQFGLCLWTKAPAGKEGETVYEATPYCFYTFADNGPDVCLSTSAISFLRNNKMDFAKWIGKGTTFANEKEEAYLKSKFLEVEEVKNGGNDNKVTLTRQNDLDFIKRNSEKLEAFVADADAKEFLFDKCNAFLRRALYQLVEETQPALTVSKTLDERIKLIKMDAAAKKSHQAAVIIENRKKYESAMGLRLVFNELVAAKKPVVGHNCMFDFLFCVTHLDGPLPDDFSEFKTKFSAMFPVVFDTKYICAEITKTLGNKDESSLGELYRNLVSGPAKDEAAAAAAADDAAANGTEIESISLNDTTSARPKVTIRYAEGFGQYNEGDGQFHDAGWDAYCTGACFVHQLAEVGSMDAMVTVAGNRLFMMQSLYHMDLDPARPSGILKIPGSLIFVGSFGESTKTEHIVDCCVTAGYELTTLEVLWIDGTSTFVAINTTDSAAEIVQKLTANLLPERKEWVVQTYDDYKNPKPVVAEGDDAGVEMAVEGTTEGSQEPKRPRLD